MSLVGDIVTTTRYILKQRSSCVGYALDDLYERWEENNILTDCLREEFCTETGLTLFVRNKTGEENSPGHFFYIFTF